MRVALFTLVTLLVAAVVPPAAEAQQHSPAASEHQSNGHGVDHHGARHGNQDGAARSGEAAGEAAPLAPSDDRTPVRLTAGERDFVLGEMRTFLRSVQGIVAAIADDQPAKVAKEARVSGMGTRHTVPRTLMMKMPAEWRTLGMDTHSRFDTLALEAESIGDRTQLLGQLSGILTNCTDCHAAYRLVAE